MKRLKKIETEEVEEDEKNLSPSEKDVFKVNARSVSSEDEEEIEENKKRKREEQGETKKNKKIKTVQLEDINSLIQQHVEDQEDTILLIQRLIGLGLGKLTIMKTVADTKNIALDVAIRMVLDQINLNKK
jgi:hypothetical protein